MGASAAIVMGVTTLASSYSQSEATRDQGRYQKMMNDINARNSDIAGEDALQRGDKEAANYKKKVKGMVGSQRAEMAAQGIDINDGSALAIQEDTRSIGAMDALTIKNNAFREAMGFKTQSQSYSFQGDVAKSQSSRAANNTLLAGGLQAASTSYGAYYGGKKG